MKGYNEKTNNPVAKNAHKFNKRAAGPHKDKKKAMKKGDRKHKGSYESVEEVLKVSDGASAWIKDFQSSDAPQFKGKSMDKRKEMALAAYLDAKKGSKEESMEEWSCNTTEKTRRVKGGDKRKKYMKEKQVDEKKGLWDRIHAKRKRGEKPAKPGDKDYPKTLDVGEGLKQARKNVGSDSCWDGYKATGTKMKGGKEVPDCKKEAALPPHLQKILDKKGNVDPKKVAKHVHGRKGKSNVTDVTPKGYGPKESAQDRLDRMAAKHGLGKPNKAADDYMAKMRKKYGAKDDADLKRKMGMKEASASGADGKTKVRMQPAHHGADQKESTDLQERPDGVGGTTYTTHSMRKKAMQNPKVAKRVADVQKREKERKAGMSFSQKLALRKRQRAGQVKRHQSNNDRADDANQKAGRIESMDPRDYTDKPGYVVVVKNKKGEEEIKHYSPYKPHADRYARKVHGGPDKATVYKTDGRKIMKEDVDQAQLKLKHAKERESLKSKHAREKEQAQSTNEYKYQLDCKDHLEELTQRELDMMAARKQKNLVKRGKAKAEPKKPASAGRTQNTGRSGGEDDSSLVMQLRKAQDLRGNHDIQFKGGKTKLPKQMIDKLLNTYDKLTKPADKKKFETLVTHELRKKEGIATQKSKTAADKAMDKFNRTRKKGLPAPRGKQSGPSASDLRDIERGK